MDEQKTAKHNKGKTKNGQIKVSQAFGRGLTGGADYGLIHNYRADLIHETLLVIKYTRTN